MAEQKKTAALAVIGVLLATLIGAGVFFAITKGKNLFAPRSWDGEAFYRELSEFDALLVKSESFEKPETLNRALDKLERKALGVESYLSTLKRRRLLARQDPRFIAAYQKAAQAAAEALPSSEALAAAAAEALLLGSPAIDQETERKLRIYSSRLSEEPLKPVALGVHILLEDLRDPVKAETIPNKETLFSAVAPETKGFGSFDLSVDLLLLQILQGDIPGASARINSLLHDSGVLARRPDLLQLAAEFFYDFDAPLRAAELFAQSSDQRSLARQADSLWLSGYVSGSRNLWNLLLAPERSGADNADSAITARSLYNLAATTENPDEKRANLYNFMKQFSATGKGDAYYVYGLIYYSRLLEASHSIQVLETAETEGHVLLDLELLRRRSGTWTIEKSVAETWLLVNQYPDDPRIYQWGCYFFDLQRRYDETAELIRQAELRQIAAPWIDFHIALRLLREGRLNEGMERLNAIVPPHFMWQVPADIARIMEISHDPSGALEYYETAASLVKDRKSAAKILFRMSRCFRTLGKEQESLYALEESLRFDPDYLDARLELQRRGLP